MLKEILGIFKETWPVFQDNLGVTLSIPAILCIVPTALIAVPTGIIGFGVAVWAGGARMPVMPCLIGVGTVGVLCFAVVYNSIRVGWTTALLALASNQEASFGNIKEGMPWFVNFLLVNLIIGIATVIGGYCFIVPGIFVAVRTSFAPFLVVDENLGPIQALIKSNERVTGYSWQILIYHCLYWLVGMVVGMIPIIGSIAVMGFFDLALARIYLLKK